MSDNRGTSLTAGGTWLKNILNISVADDTWVAISLGDTDTCRAISAGLRSGANFKLSHLSDGARYKTVYGVIEMDMIKDDSGRLFYVQTASGNDTLECILLD